MAEFTFNPKLGHILENYPGNKCVKGRFKSLYSFRHPGLSDILKWKLGSNPLAEKKKKDDFEVRHKVNHDFPNAEEDQIIWLGHASFFIRFCGVNFIFDPCLTDLPFLPRKVPLPLPITCIRNVDFVCLSHAHRDHFDEGSLKTLRRNNPQARFLVPLETGKLLNKIKIPDFQEAGWYQQYDLSENPEVIFLPAQHWNRRGLFDHNETLWGSFLLRDPKTGRTIYFAGDSGYGKHYKDFRQVIGEPDICIMPIGAYLPRFIMKNAHMDPHESFRAFNDLGGKVFIPMHYGTFDLSDEPPGDPIRIIRKLFEESDSGKTLMDLAVGEQFFLV